MMLSDFSVKRPVAAIVLNLLLIVFGVIAFQNLPLREYPDINPPIINIETLYPGASAEIIESRVTQIIEDRISGLEGIKSIESDSEDGRSTITIEFQESRDVDDAANDIRDRVSRVRDDLPDEIEAPEISKVDANEDVIIWYNLASNNLTSLELNDYAERFIVDRLAIVDGVSRVRIGGQRRYAMRVWLDPLKLAARDLTVADVENALRRENVELPAGRLESYDREYTLRVERHYQKPEDFQKLVIQRDVLDRNIVRLGDVARVELGAASDRNELRGNGQPMVGLGIIKQTQANTLAVARGVDEAINRIRESLPQNIQIFDSYDSSVFIDIAIGEVYRTLFIAIGLVAIVTYLFLGNLKLTLIPMLTVPIALTASFIALLFLGYSVNILTLLALVLAIGLVVDDSIVVLENNFRRVKKGESPLLASYLGTRQVGFAVIVTTVSTIAVFLPIIFLEGRTGRLFSEFVVALSAAVVVSSLTALTLVPVCTSKFLQISTLGNRSSFIDRLMEILEIFYEKIIRRLIRIPKIVLMVFILFIATIGYLIHTLPREYAPREDRGAFFVFVNGPEGASYTYMNRKMLEIESKLNFMLEENLATRVLVRTPRSFSNDEIVNDGIVIVVLKPWEERPAAKEIMSRVQSKIAQVEGVRSFAVMRSGLATRGTSRPVQFVIGGTNYQQLASWRDIILDKMKENDFVTRLDYDYKETKPKYRLKIRRDLAADLGITTEDIGRSLETLFASRNVTTYFLNGQEYDVILQAERDSRRSQSDLDRIFLRSAKTDSLIPLRNMITIDEVADSQQLNRYNRIRAITIEGTLKPGKTVGEAIDFMNSIVDEYLPPEVIVDYKGESLDYVTSAGENIFVFIIATIVIYLVLAAQFESFVHPFVVMLTVPTAIFGALLGLLIASNTLNIFSSIALVMLIGLSAKNGILIVEFINQLRDEGLNFISAVIEASKIRLRPILMTSLSTTIGSVPLVLSSGAGSESRITIGLVILFGMFFSTLISIFVIPTFYVFFAKKTGSPSQQADQLEKELKA